VAIAAGADSAVDRRQGFEVEGCSMGEGCGQHDGAVIAGLQAEDERDGRAAVHGRCAPGKQGQLGTQLRCVGAGEDGESHHRGGAVRQDDVKVARFRGRRHVSACVGEGWTAFSGWTSRSDAARSSAAQLEGGRRAGFSLACTTCEREREIEREFPRGVQPTWGRFLSLCVSCRSSCKIRHSASALDDEFEAIAHLPRFVSSRVPFFSAPEYTWSSLYTADCAAIPICLCVYMKQWRSTRNGTGRQRTHYSLIADWPVRTGPLAMKSSCGQGPVICDLSHRREFRRQNIRLVR
jgi:hypothetical protein